MGERMLSRYGAVAARSYDVLSGELVYGIGRRLAVSALGLREGQHVLDLGCGTGLNLPLLTEAVGPHGRVAGLDLSPHMLAVARGKCERRGWSQVQLCEGDATDVAALRRAGAGRLFDAVLATYTLSLMPEARTAWSAVTEVLRPGARVGVVDMARPTSSWAVPAARLACWLGGADLHARPWEVVEDDLVDSRAWDRRRGHVQVRVGTWR